MASCASRHELSLSETLRSTVKTSSNLYNQLLDILFKIPGLLEESERIKFSNEETYHTLASNLLLKALHIEEDLLQWYERMNTTHAVSEPLFLIQPGPVRNGKNVTEAKITFRNESIIPPLLLYWLGLVLVYTIITAALRAPESMGVDSFKRQEFAFLCSSLSQGSRQKSIAFNFASTLAHEDSKKSVLTYAWSRRSHYVQRISDSMLDCANKSFGTAIVATLTSSVMHQFCPKPVEDLTYLFEVFGRRGLKFSYV